MPASKSRGAAAKTSSGKHKHEEHCCDHDHGPMCELSIRRYRKEDYKGLATAWKSGDIALDDTDSARAIDRNLKERSKGYQIFVAEARMVDPHAQRKQSKQNEGRIAGGVVFTFDGHRAYIYHLAVHKDFRGVGIGRALLETCEQQAKLWGARHLRLSSRVDESRMPARALYEDAGWKASGEIQTYQKTLP